MDFNGNGFQDFRIAGQFHRGFSQVLGYFREFRTISKGFVKVLKGFHRGFGDSSGPGRFPCDIKKVSRRLITVHGDFIGFQSFTRVSKNFIECSEEFHDLSNECQKRLGISGNFKRFHGISLEIRV